MRSFLSMDGESIQLEASLDIETMTNMHDNGIDYAKGPIGYRIAPGMR
jgi:hypothetical protein